MTHAIVIGIDSYANPRWKLSGAVRDAIAFARWVTEQRTRGTEERWCLLVSGGRADIPLGWTIAEPTPRNIRDVLRECRRVGGDELLLFFAGHACTLPNRHPDSAPILVPYDLATFEDVGVEGVDLALEIEKLRAGGPRRQMFFIDGCREVVDENGPIVASQTATWNLTRPVPDIVQGVLFATKMRAFAHELGGRGVFTSALLAGLSCRGPILEQDGNEERLYFRELGDFVRTLVGKLLERRGLAAPAIAAQVPTLALAPAEARLLVQTTPAPVMLDLRVRVEPRAARAAATFTQLRWNPMQQRFAPEFVWSPEDTPVRTLSVRAGELALQVEAPGFEPQVRRPTIRGDSALFVELAPRFGEAVHDVPTTRLSVTAEDAATRIEVRSADGRVLVTGRGSAAAPVAPGTLLVESFVPGLPKRIDRVVAHGDACAHTIAAPELQPSHMAVVADQLQLLDGRRYLPSQHFGVTSELRLSSLLAYAAWAAAWHAAGRTGFERLAAVGVTHAAPPGRAAARVLVGDASVHGKARALEAIRFVVVRGVNEESMPVPRPLSGLQFAVESEIVLDPGAIAIRMELRGRVATTFAAVAISGFTTTLVIAWEEWGDLEVGLYLVPTDPLHVRGELRAAAERDIRDHDVAVRALRDRLPLVEGELGDDPNPLAAAITGYRLHELGKLDRFAARLARLLPIYPELGDLHLLEGLRRGGDDRCFAEAARRIPVVASGYRLLARKIAIAHPGLDPIPNSLWTTFASSEPTRRSRADTPRSCGNGRVFRMRIDVERGRERLVVTRLYDPDRLQIAAHVSTLADLPADAAPETQGRLLAGALFGDGSVFATLLDTRARVRRGDGELHIHVQVDAEDRAAAWCWEALSDAREPLCLPEWSGTRLAMGSNVAFARAIEVPADVPPWRTSRTTADIRALVIVSAPQLPLEIAASWTVDPESATPARDRAKAVLRGIGSIAYLDGPVTVASIGDQLRREQPDIIYLACGGGSADAGPELLLDAAQHGRTTPLEGLLAGLANLEHRPSVVYCAPLEGATYRGFAAIAAAIVQRAGIPVAIAMHDGATEATAGAFAAAFFTTLKQTGSVQRAATAARTRIETRADWWAPIVTTRATTDAVFDRDATGERAWAIAAEKSATQIAQMHAQFGLEELYVPRDLEVGELRNFFDASDRTVMAIVGQSGMGKTTLVARVLKERHEQGHLCFFVRSATLQTPLATFEEHLVAGMVGPDLPPARFWPAIDAECEVRNRLVIVVIDAINEFTPYRGTADQATPLDFLARLDAFAQSLHSSGRRRVKLVVTSRPEVWRRGIESDRARLRASDNAYHVTQNTIGHVLDRYSPGEAVLAYSKHARSPELAVRTSYTALSPMTRYQLRDPLLLRLTCAAYHDGEGEIPDELDSSRVFAAFDDRIRTLPGGFTLLAAIENLVAAMFDAGGRVVERDAITVDATLQRDFPQLFAGFASTDPSSIGSTLQGLNVVREERGLVRFTYDRYAEYRLSERLLQSIALAQSARRPRHKAALAIIRANLPSSFRLTIVFRALRRTLRLLAREEKGFLVVLKELAEDERGLALVVSVLATLATRPSATEPGVTLVASVLDDLQTRVDRARSARVFPIIDVVHRILLDEEYSAWLDSHPGVREAHYEIFDRRFSWGLRHANTAVSKAAVQYLFFMWQNPVARPHALRILRGLIANAPSLSRVVRASDRRFFQNLVGVFMLVLAEARSAEDASTILPMGAILLQGIRPTTSIVYRAIDSAPRVVAGLIVDRMLGDNQNPVNFEALDEFFHSRTAQRDAAHCIDLLRPAADWSVVTDAHLAQLVATTNAFALELACFALSVRWEHLTSDEERGVHLARLDRLFAQGSSSARYCVALALYHINYFGESPTRASIERMRTMVETILSDEWGMFHFRGSTREQNTNVIGTFGRVLARNAELVRDHRDVGERPVLAFAIDTLEKAKQTSRADVYEYVCDNVGLLGTLAEPHNVLDVFGYILADLWPERFAWVVRNAPRTPVPIPREWDDTRQHLRDVVMTSLANIRVLYRAEIDRFLLDVLDSQDLYTQIATRQRPDFHLATFYSWMSEQLMYRMLTRYYDAIGADYLDALIGAMDQKDRIDGIRFVAKKLLVHLEDLRSSYS